MLAISLSERPSGKVIGRRNTSPRASFRATSFAEAGVVNRYSPAFSSRCVPVRNTASRNVHSSRTTPASPAALPMALDRLLGAGARPGAWRDFDEPLTAALALVLLVDARVVAAGHGGSERGDGHH